jgi:hypothetical protein
MNQNQVETNPARPFETNLPHAAQVKVLERMRLEWEEAKFAANINLVTARLSRNDNAIAMAKKSLLEATAALDYISKLSDSITKTA